MFKNLFQKFWKYKNKQQMDDPNFVVISNNCWGAEIYKELELQFNTPFIGLFVYSYDYINLLENFNDIDWKDLKFTNKSKWTDKMLEYPIGLLQNDIEIHFLHYGSEEEALEKWTRRVLRMEKVPFDRYFFKIDDRDLSDDNVITRFHNLPYSSVISFTLKKFPFQNNFQIFETEDKIQVPDGLKLYRISKKYFNVLKWLSK